MKICHISDTHSRFRELVGDFDVIVHSGDMLPDAPRTSRKLGSKLYQRDWIRENAENFKKWIGDKPFLFSSGNHDYEDPCSELKDLGINAINLDNKIVEFNGYKFYGFPYIPYIGVWNWELTEDKMRDELVKLVEIINKEKIDVLVAHCPPYGILDLAMSNIRYGNPDMVNALNSIKHFPKFYLCGHIHNDNGSYWLAKGKNTGIMISNAATTQRIIEL